MKRCLFIFLAALLFLNGCVSSNDPKETSVEIGAQNDYRVFLLEHLQTVTEALDGRYTTLRGFTDQERSYTFRIYWDLDQKKYVVGVDTEAGTDKEILTFQDDRILLYDVEKEIRKGKYKEGGKLELVTDGSFVMEPTAGDKEDILKQLWLYLLKMIHGVSTDATVSGNYGVEAYLKNFTLDQRDTSVQVIYDCGLEGGENKLSWDCSFDHNSRIYAGNTEINWEVAAEPWGYDYRTAGVTGSALKLTGTLEEQKIIAEDESTDWGPLLQAAGILQLQENGTFENIKGEIYMTSESDEAYESYEGWICFDGKEPVKVAIDDSQELVREVTILEDAAFDSGTVLWQLSFDLSCERVNQELEEHGEVIVKVKDPLEALMEGYTPEQAAEDGCVVSIDGEKIAGGQAWLDFVAKAERGEIASVRLYSGHSWTDSNYRIIEVVYNGKQFIASHYSELDSYGKRALTEVYYAYIVYEEGYVSKDGKQTINGYILANSPEVNIEGLYRYFPLGIAYVSDPQSIYYQAALIYSETEETGGD